MTREEFIKKHADEYLAKLMRAFTMDPKEPLSGRWLMTTIQELDGWLGRLHDTLTRLKNAQGKGKPEGESEKAGAGGPQAATYPYGDSS